MKIKIKNQLLIYTCIVILLITFTYILYTVTTQYILQKQAPATLENLFLQVTNQIDRLNQETLEISHNISYNHTVHNYLNIIFLFLSYLKSFVLILTTAIPYLKNY